MVTIAIVDDDPLLRDLLGEAFDGRGYQVVAYDRWRPALDGLIATAPDLLVCDVDLPDGSGLDLVARLRSAHGETLPVLMLSGRVDEADIIRGFAAGATDYLTKPIGIPQLLAKVSVLLARSGGATRVVPDGDRLPGGAAKAFGRYRIEGILGQGSFGVVYRAVDLNGGRQVALKVLSGAVSMQAETRMRFLRETYALSAVQDRHVVRVHDFGSAEGRLYYAMDFVPGRPADAATAERLATEAEARAVARGLALGVRAIHAAGVVHRDLKPANIILAQGRWDRPVIVDFGLAKQPFDRGLTDPDVIIGTPGYMAPEVILGMPLAPASDLYSLGLVIRFALVGREVFPDLSGLPLLKAISSRPVDLPGTITHEFRALLRRLVQIDASRRTPTAEQLLRDLDAIESSRPLPAS